MVVPVNPMNRAEEFKHYVTDAGRAWPSARPTAAGAAAADAELPAEQRLQHLLVTQYADALPPAHEHPGRSAGLADRDARAAARRHRGMRAGRRAGRASTAGPDDMAVMPYTSGTTGFPRAASIPTAR